MPELFSSPPHRHGPQATRSAKPGPVDTTIAPTFEGEGPVKPETSCDSPQGVMEIPRLGVIQREVLEFARANRVLQRPHLWLTVHNSLIFASDPPSRRVSVSRAISSLVRQGLIEKGYYSRAGHRMAAIRIPLTPDHLTAADDLEDPYNNQELDRWSSWIGGTTELPRPGSALIHPFFIDSTSAT